MKALSLQAPRRLVYVEIDEPRPGPGEVVLRVQCVGVCGSDVHCYNGEHPYVRYPVIPGHEIGAEVAVVGDGVRGLQPGSRVVVEPLLPCGACYACGVGRTNCCENLAVLGIHRDGALCPYVCVPARCVLPAPAGFTFDDAAMAETLSIGVHAVRRAGVCAGETVVVIGCGPIGLSIGQVAQAYGARVLALEVLASRIALAQKLGFWQVVDAGSEDPRQAVAELTGGKGAPVVIEAVGLPETIEETVDFAGNAARVVIVGLGDQPVCFPQAVFPRKELDFRGSRNSCDDMAEVLRLMHDGLVDMRQLITHHIPFDEAAERFPWIGDHKDACIKAIVTL